MTTFENGFLLGILVGEGHFGGDGRQPQITLRMHTDHEALFRWLEQNYPGGKLYGPYHHSGRSYYQWMARGQFLREVLLPILDAYLRPELDGKTFARYRTMKERYRLPEVSLRQHAQAAPLGDVEKARTAASDAEAEVYASWLRRTRMRL